jgi:MFS family permease
MLWQPMLNVAFPLWLATRTHTPIALVGVLYAVNTGLCVVLQYPVSALAATPREALRSYALAAAALAAASATFAVAPALAGSATVAAFVVGVSVLTVAELAGAGAAWTLSFAIAPDDRRGTYLSAFGTGRTMSTRVAGPLLMTGVVLALGVRGWLLLAVLFALATVPPLMVARQDRRRPGAGRALPSPGGAVVPSGTV